MKGISPTLMVRDVDASLAFYHEILGFPQTDALRDREGKPVHGMAGRGSVMVMFGPIADPPTAKWAYRGTGVNLYVDVGDEDIDAYYQSVAKAGATITQPIETQFWGDRTFGVVDPDGYHLTFSKTVQEVSEEDLQKAVSR